jgi:hypothetical protein
MVAAVDRGGTLRLVVFALGIDVARFSSQGTSCDVEVGRDRKAVETGFGWRRRARRATVRPCDSSAADLLLGAGSRAVCLANWDGSTQERKSSGS